MVFMLEMLLSVTKMCKNFLTLLAYIDEWDKTAGKSILFYMLTFVLVTLVFSEVICKKFIA